MRIGILGTGIVGRSHAARLASLGHDVAIGPHDVAKTLSRTEGDAMGNPPFSAWQREHKGVKLLTFAEAASHGEMVFDALRGEAALSVIEVLTSELEGKVLVDIANPLDFSKGMPPTLTVCNTDSLGEQIQRALPRVRVVKIFNTVSAFLQVDPGQLAGGNHDLFICGNDATAKELAGKIAKSYGWKTVIDLGDITSARGMEMLMPVWLRLWGAFGSPSFNYKIVR